MTAPTSAVSIDPSWLPATVATCSATLVAIVGGLVASRRVSAEAERRADIARINQLRTGSAYARRRSEEAHQRLTARRSDEWLIDIASDLIDFFPALPSIDFLLANHPSDAESEQLSPYLAGAYRSVKSADERFHRLRRLIYWPDSWPGAVEMLELSFADPISEYLSSRVYAARSIDHDKQVRSPTARVRQLPKPKAVLRRHRSMKSLERASTIARDRDLAVRDDLEVMIHATKGDPGGERVGQLLAILTGITGFGVAWPLGALAVGAERLYGWERLAMVAVVPIGVMLVLASVLDRDLLHPWRARPYVIGPTPDPDDNEQASAAHSAQESDSEFQHEVPEEEPRKSEWT